LVPESSNDGCRRAAHACRPALAVSTPERQVTAANRTGGYVPKRLQRYDADGITVTFDPNRCIHSGVCVRGLPAVFDVGRPDWVRPSAAPADEVVAQVARCPSGALQIVRRND
jgi:uncharacterized Fe-S cluster protein YjdI